MLGREKKRFDAVLFVPLELTPLDQDVAITYVISAQALRLVVANTINAGEGFRGTMAVQSSLCSSIAFAFDEYVM